jgi:predicted TPR repeat methyltransferase
LVLAADVFIYIGALEPLFEQLARLMPAHSWLAFTAELDESGQEQDKPRLLPSLRYAHPLRYLQACAQAHGFDWHSHHQAPLRLDQGEPMLALYAYLQRR